MTPDQQEFLRTNINQDAADLMALEENCSKTIDSVNVHFAALAAELHTDERRRALGRGLDQLVLQVRDLPRVREAALYLAADVDFAWRLYAVALLADELA